MPISAGGCAGHIGCGFASSAGKGLEQFFERIRVMAGKKKDPYDVYEWLDALHLKYRLKPYYFFLLANN